jgi:hypothetical protein
MQYFLALIIASMLSACGVFEGDEGKVGQPGTPGSPGEPGQPGAPGEPGSDVPESCIGVIAALEVWGKCIDPKSKTRPDADLCVYAAGFVTECIDARLR